MISVNFKLDATAPTIITNSPTGKNVPLDTVISATFSEDMEKTSVEISISGVDGKISWNEDTITFTPNQKLEYKTVYEVEIITGLDLVGNKLEYFKWSFTTKALKKIIGRIFTLIIS